MFRFSFVGFAAVALLAALAPAASASDEIICTDPVARTGDSFSCGGRTIRLDGVKAPAVGEAGFEDSLKSLASMTRFRTVECRLKASIEKDVDLAVCFVGARNLGVRQVRGGFAVETR
jgi:endonuclease YncB( thermonuclease family)